MKEKDVVGKKEIIVNSRVSRLSLRRVTSLASAGLVLISGSCFAWKLATLLLRPTDVPTKQPLQNNNTRDANNASKERVLFITTSISEFDNGLRQTIAGYDRFSKTIVPVLRESVGSMVDAGYQVDVYFIAHYNLSTSRYRELTNALPPSVGVQVWDDATPIGYSLENSVDHVMLHTRGLSRQHRYVIKDKYFHYDLFCAFEDDMLVKSAHVDHFVRVTDTLYDLRLFAPDTFPSGFMTVQQAADTFYGPMTNRQLARTIPGFMRVEVALSDLVRSKRKNRYDQIPVDFTAMNYSNGESSVVDAGVDPSVCCHVAPPTVNDHRPATPNRDYLYFWEMDIKALGVRKMPTSSETLMSQSVLDWVVVLGGSNNEVWEDATYLVGDYWSGRDYTAQYFGPAAQRPDRRDGPYANNQGGWMGTKRQVAEWHLRWCRGGFLPYVLNETFCGKESL
jgi:hypothetical protein